MSTSVALYPMHYEYRISNNTLETLVLECADEGGIQYSKKLASDTCTKLEQGFIKVLRSAKNIKLFHSYQNKEGLWKKDLVGKIEPKRFLYPGEYSFWYCTIDFKVCINAPTRKGVGWIENESFHVGSTGWEFSTGKRRGD